MAERIRQWALALLLAAIAVGIVGTMIFLMAMEWETYQDSKAWDKYYRCELTRPYGEPDTCGR